MWAGDAELLHHLLMRIQTGLLLLMGLLSCCRQTAEVVSSEGSKLHLSCNYSVKAHNLQWYRQDPGSAPRVLLLITDTKEPTVVEGEHPNPRLTAELNEERNRLDLLISSAAATDSAVYYCALQPTVTGNSKSV
uniref:Ig-like domain-containing protein n=2 Tax=Nothobranchius TaxID=28779 RepID=A0A8C6LXT9_NOTFU